MELFSAFSHIGQETKYEETVLSQWGLEGMARDGNTAEYQAVKRMAEVAGMRHQVHAGCNGFGPTLRRSVAMAKAIQHEAFVTSTAGMDFSQLGQALSTLARNTSLPHALKAARLAHRAQAAAKREEENKHKVVLQDFQSRFGFDVCGTAVSAFPFLKKEELEAIPGPHGLYCLQYKPQTVQKATAAVAYTFQHRGDGSDMLGNQLSDLWDKLHETMTADTKTEDWIEDVGTVSTCKQAGFCFCANPSLKRLRQCFLETLKQFMKQPGVKDYVREGHLVLHLVSAGTAHGSTLGATSSTAHTLATQAIWVHVSLMYLKPFRPTLQMLKEVPNPEPWVHAHDDVVYVEATSKPNITNNPFQYKTLPSLPLHYFGSLN
eukprot:720348-Amphidinium_carterae.2